MSVEDFLLNINNNWVDFATNFWNSSSNELIVWLLWVILFISLVSVIKNSVNI